MLDKFTIQNIFYYLNIDTIPILNNDLRNYVLLEVISLYTILRKITYFEVGRFYEKDDKSAVCLVVYFFTYLINLVGNVLINVSFNKTWYITKLGDK